MDADNNFIVVWASFGQLDGADISSVFGQRHDVNGLPVGGEFQINTYTTEYQYRPSVAMDADGNFVVVWTDYQMNFTKPNTWRVAGQRFANDGYPLGGEFSVPSYLPNQNLPSVTSDADGNFVIAWTGFTSSISGSDIYGHRFDSSGALLDFEFHIPPTSMWTSTAISSSSGRAMDKTVARRVCSANDSRAMALPLAPSSKSTLTRPINSLGRPCR